MQNQYEYEQLEARLDRMFAYRHPDFNIEQSPLADEYHDIVDRMNEIRAKWRK